MSKNEKSKLLPKPMTYLMQPEVQDAIESIMKLHGIATITKAINYCITNHIPLLDELRNEQSESNKLYHEKMVVEDASSRMIKALRELDKYTKTS